MGPVKAYSARSRNGCVTCKKRRVKCDETRPKCQRCEKLKVECIFQDVSLTWEDEADERGITFGRSLKARTKKREKFMKMAMSLDQSLDRSVKVKPEDIEPSIQQLLLKTHENRVQRREQYLFLNVTTFELTQLSNGEQIDTSKQMSSSSTSPSSSHSESSPFANIFEQAQIPTLTSNTTTKSKSDAFDFIFNDFAIPILSFDDLFVDTFASFPISQMINAPEPSLDQCSFQLDSTEKRMMEYFIDKIAPGCVCCEVKSSNKNALNSYIAPELNPYLHLIIPLSFQSELLMKTVVAASAAQLSLLGDSQYEELAQKYLKEVVSEIPKIIKAKSDLDGWDDVFAIIIMLCFIEISVSCNNSWLALLNYAKAVLKGSSGVKEKVLSPMGRFFVRYFISHEVMGETAWVHDGDHDNSTKSDATKSVTIDDDPFIQELKKDYDTKIDLVFGCSPYLISLIHRISVIGQGLDDIELESPGENKALYTKEILRHAEETEQMLNYLNQKLPNNSEIYFDAEERASISTIAEIKRLGALLYLYAVVYSTSQPETSTVNPRKCTLKIMELCNGLPDCYMSLIWPLFVVGLVGATDDENVRWFVLDKLRQMERKRRLKTVQAAREIVMNVWKETDLGVRPTAHWREIMKGKTTSISLA